MLQQPTPPSAQHVQREAQAAAGHFTDVNAACPYPFTTEAGRIFRDEFIWCRSVIDAKAQATGAAQ